MKTKFWVTSVLLLLSVAGRSQRSVKNEGMKFSLDAVLIQADTFYFNLSLNNNSLVGYKPGFIKLFVRDRHIAKRTAVQEKEIIPFSTIRFFEVNADSLQTIGLRLLAFTIPKTKELVIETTEKNGARAMALHIRGHRLLKMVKQLNK